MVKTGDELFVSYGSDSWFTLRNICIARLDPTSATSASSDDVVVPDQSTIDTESISPYRRPIEDLVATGHCMSQVYVDESSIDGAGSK